MLNCAYRNRFIALAAMVPVSLILASCAPESASGDDPADLLAQVATYPGDAPTGGDTAQLSGRVGFPEECMTITPDSYPENAFVPVFPKNALTQDGDAVTFTSATGVSVELAEGAEVHLGGGSTLHPADDATIPASCEESLYGTVHSVAP